MLDSRVAFHDYLVILVWYVNHCLLVQSLTFFVVDNFLIFCRQSGKDVFRTKRVTRSVKVAKSLFRRYRCYKKSTSVAGVKE